MLEDFLELHASGYPDKVALVSGSDLITYAELWDRVRVRACTFKSNGMLQKGFHILKATQSIEFLIDYFATHVCGCVAVPVEPGITEERFNALDNLVSAAAFPEHTADILFTTGTTGKSKGVVVSHEAILANAENLVEAHLYTPDLNFIICGPLNHLGSLSKVYPMMRQGGTIYLMDGMKDINRFFQLLDNEGKFATFLVPASIRMMLQIHKSRLASYASKLDFIETGAAPMTLAEMQILRTILPETRLYNTYASTETGIVATYNFNCDDCKAGCVGRPMINSDFFISNTGKVACKGKTLMTGYINDEELTAEVLKEGAVYTSDLGEIDEEGRLFLKGRADDIINVGGYKVAPTDIEEIAIKYPSIADCICIKAEHPVIGTVLKLLVVVKDGETFNKKDIYKYLSHYLENYQLPFYYEKVEQISRTFNGKLNRKYYSEIKK